MIARMVVYWNRLVGFGRACECRDMERATKRLLGVIHQFTLPANESFIRGISVLPDRAPITRWIDPVSSPDARFLDRGKTPDVLL